MHPDTWPRANPSHPPAEVSSHPPAEVSSHPRGEVSSHPRDNVTLATPARSNVTNAAQAVHTHARDPDPPRVTLTAGGDPDRRHARWNIITRSCERRHGAPESRQQGRSRQPAPAPPRRLRTRASSVATLQCRNGGGAGLRARSAPEPRFGRHRLGHPPPGASAPSMSRSPAGRSATAPGSESIASASSATRTSAEPRHPDHLAGPRTLIDIAPTLDDRELELAVHEALAINCSSLRTRGPPSTGIPIRRGCARLVELGHPSPRTATRSGGEEELFRLIRRSGLPRRTVNAQLDRWNLDFYWPEHRLVVEVDGIDFHSHASASSATTARISSCAAVASTCCASSGDRSDASPRWCW